MNNEFGFFDRILFITDEPNLAPQATESISPNNFVPAMLRDFGGVVLGCGRQYRAIVKAIRQDPDFRIYLKPLFACKETAGEIIEYGRLILDGVIDGNAIERFLNEHNAVITEINKRIASYASAPSTLAPGEYGLAIKALRYVQTRGSTIKPVRFSRSVSGYSYPAIDVLVGKNHYQQFSLVDFLENRALIEGSFIDRIHACTFCYSSFLNFREICVNCQSPNIANEDLVHHFPCGNIGPESDYDHAGELVCPKCRKALRHIGVDFDRPSQVFNCNACGHDFQEPMVDALCINCGKVIASEKLLFRTIKEFSLTPLGEASAHSGIVYSLREEFAGGLDVIGLESFMVALNLEIERIKRYKKTLSTLVRFSFSNFQDILEVLGSESVTFFKQIGKEISDFLRKTDLVSFMDDRSLLFLLTETNTSNSRTALNRLEERISSLAGQSFKVSLVMQDKCLELDGSRDSGELIQELRTDV